MHEQNEFRAGQYGDDRYRGYPWGWFRQALHRNPKLRDYYDTRRDLNGPKTKASRAKTQQLISEIITYIWIESHKAGRDEWTWLVDIERHFLHEKRVDGRAGDRPEDMHQPRVRNQTTLYRILRDLVEIGTLEKTKRVVMSSRSRKTKKKTNTYFRVLLPAPICEPETDYDRARELQMRLRIAGILLRELGCQNPDERIAERLKLEGDGQYAPIVPDK